MSKKDGKNVSGEGGMDFGIGVLFKGLTGLVEKLGDLAEKGEELRKTVEIRDPESKDKVKGICGFSVKVGLGGEDVKVEPFGNIRKDEATGQAVVEEVREPMADVLEEKDHVLVVAEMPGVGSEDVKLDVKDDILSITAEKGDKKYRKEVLLPGTFSSGKMEVSCNNGIVEIKCAK